MKRQITCSCFIIVFITIMSLSGFASGGQKKNFSICDGLSGAAFGLCKGGVAVGCDQEAGSELKPGCEAIEEKFEEVAGSEAPWLYKIVFVTSIEFATGTPYDSDDSPNTFSSLSDADCICQDLAEAASLPGTYMAWLSTDDASQDTRFITKSTVPYVRPDMEIVAEDWNDLTNGPYYPEPGDWIINSISVDENGNFPEVGSTGVLTGTSPDGTAYIEYNSPDGTAYIGYNCEGWTVHNLTSSVLRGASHATNSSWSGDETLSCAGMEGTGRLYCFQQ